MPQVATANRRERRRRAGSGDSATAGDRGPVGEGITQKPGLEQPIYYWDPNVAPGGMLFYTGDKFPEWKGDLLISGMIDKRLHRLKLDGRKVVAEDWVQLDARLRDVAQGPDGSLYLITDELFGKLIKLSPRGGR